MFAVSGNGWLLQSLLNGESIEEIAINGFDEVWVSRTESDAPDHPPASATSAPTKPRPWPWMTATVTARRPLLFGSVAGCLLNERVRSLEELHPVSAPNAGLGPRR